jgi:histidinol phosphatase-like PHP family hydrolase
MNVLNIDLHVHCGNERWGLPMSAFVEGLRSRGVVLAGLLDHAEFYLPADNNEWIRNLYVQMREKNLPHYEANLSGLRALYRDIDAQPRPAGLRILKGLEFNNTVATPDEFLLEPQYVCFCFGDVAGEPGATFGERAAARIRQVGEKVRRSGKSGIINHPFRNRSWMYRDALAAGAPARLEDWVSRDDVARMVEAAKEWGLALEINQSDLVYHDKPELRPILELFIHAARLMVECGADLSIGSDSHSPPVAFSPAVLETIATAGVTDQHLSHILGRLAAA